MLRVSIPLAPIKEGIGEVIGLDAAEMSGRGQSGRDGVHGRVARGSSRRCSLGGRLAASNWG